MRQPLYTFTLQKRASVLLLCFLLVPLLLSPIYITRACAQEFKRPEVNTYPAQAVTIFVPSLMQAHEDMGLGLAQPLFKARTSEQISLIPKPGRGGALAVNALLQAPADGYHLALATLPGFFWQGEIPDSLFKPGEISPILMVAESSLALWVPKDSPYHTLDDLLTAIRNLPEGDCYIAGTGRYTAHHMANNMLNRSAGILTHYLPQVSLEKAYLTAKKGKAIAFWGKSLLSKNLEGARPLAVTSATSYNTLPHVPSFLELNHQVHIIQQLCLVMLKATPQPIQLNAADFLQSVLCDPGFQAILEGKGYTPLCPAYEQLPAMFGALQSQASGLLEEFPLGSND